MKNKILELLKKVCDFIFVTERFESDLCAAYEWLSSVFQVDAVSRPHKSAILV